LSFTYVNETLVRAIIFENQYVNREGHNYSLSFSKSYNSSPNYVDFDKYSDNCFQTSSNAVSIKEDLNSHHNYCPEFCVQMINYHDKYQIQSCFLDASIKEHKTSQETSPQIFDNQPRSDYSDDNVDFHKQHED